MALLCGLLLLGATILGAALFPPTWTWVVPANAITRETGFAHVIDLRKVPGADLPELLMPFDNGAHPEASTLRLLFNGEPAGVPHGNHEAIRNTGDGRYSHWDRSVYFALPDNAPPPAGALQLRLQVRPPIALTFLAATPFLVGLYGIALAFFSRLPMATKTVEPARARVEVRAQAIGLIGILASLTVIVSALTPVQMTWRVPQQAVAKEEGYAYRIELDRILGTDLPEHMLPFDNGEHPEASTLELLADGRPVGPPHVYHGNIREKGDGAFSHWDRFVLFALTGNVDPSTVDLTLRLALRPPLALVLLVTGLLAFFVWLCFQSAFLRLVRSPAAQAILPVSPASKAGYFVVTAVLATILCGIYMRGVVLNDGGVGMVPDSWGYLRPALTWLTGGAHELIYGRSIGYPYFLGWTIKLLGADFISIAQSLLTVVSGAAVTAGLVIATRNEWLKSPLLTVVVAALSIMGLTALLAYQPLSNFAHMILAESVSGFTVGITAFLVIAAGALGRRPIALSIFFVFGIFFAATAYYTKPSVAAYALLAIAFLMIALWTRPGLARWLKSILTAGAALVVLVVYTLPQQASHDARGSLFGPVTLFCNHANIVADALPADALSNKARADVRRLLEDTVNMGENGWPRLGFNGDTCFYLSGISQIVTTELGNDVDAERSFYMSAFLAGVLKHPTEYAAKVFDQMAFAVLRPYPSISTHYTHNRLFYDEALELPEMAISTVRISRPDGGPAQPLLDFSPALDRAGKWMLGALQASIGWMLLVLGALFVAALARLALGRNNLALFLADWLPTMTLFALYAASTSIVALSHTFDLSRYAEALAPLTMLFHLVGWVRIVSALRNGWLRLWSRLS